MRSRPSCRAMRPAALPSAAVLDVAGPIENNRCALTNSHWIIDGAELEVSL